MRSVSLGTAVLVLLGADLSIAVDKTLLKGFSQSVSGDGFLAMPVGTVNRPPGARRAANAFEDQLNNMDFFYATDVNIGSPPQRVTVLVDTGSSELWVNPDCTTTKTRQQANQCQQFGQYNPQQSNQSYGPFGKEQLNYGDPSDPKTQTSVLIHYYADTVALGDAKIDNQTFGVVSESKGQAQGIMGLAPDLKGGFTIDEPYSLVLDSMAQQGVISSRVFSLDLRHSDDQYGAVIYGGLDRNKFIGALEKRPIVKGVGGEWRLAVELTTIGITMSSSSSFAVNQSDANVMLDSGTTISRMHSTVAVPILRALNATDDGEGYYQVPCSAKTSGGSVDFGFGSKTIRVPLKDFILDLSGSTDTCYVGMVLTTDQQILGDSVLRAGYFVFDWDNQEVHIAQADNCGKNDIIAVSSGTDAVPSATGNCKASDTSVTVTSTGTGSAQPTSTTGSVSTKTYTTAYTITSCPSIDPACVTGVVTTQTAQAVSTGGGGNKNAGVRVTAISSLLVIIGVAAMACNIL
ncbi:secreted aspartic proteinase [Metarhizium anisopliae]|nr:secreted aspartic proteinase [Metarhizium anisopliae]